MFYANGREWKRELKEQKYSDLEKEWYEKLRKSGFVDIEDTRQFERPLKDWHSTKFASERSRIRQAQREAYNKKLEDFLNSNAINEICALMTKHGRNTIGPKKAKNILILHLNGEDERKIAKKKKCSRDVVNRTLRKAKEWMRVA